MKTLKDTLKESLLDDFGSQAKDLRKEQITKWLKKNNETKNTPFVINEDFTVDIKDFNYIGVGDFPEYINFRNCNGDFTLDRCCMTSLRGCPSYVKWDFNCSDNVLKSLKGAPKYIGNEFNCEYNELTSLEGGPEDVGNSYICSNNKLVSLKGCPRNAAFHGSLDVSPQMRLPDIFPHNDKCFVWKRHTILRFPPAVLFVTFCTPVFPFFSQIK